MTRHSGTETAVSSDGEAALRGDQPRVTIILVTYNSRERVIELLCALRHFTRTRHEIVVVDNASTDGTCEYLARVQAEGGIRLITNSTNLQCAAATNLAIAVSRTEYVVYLCASHALVSGPGWDEALIDFMDKRPEIEIAGHVWNPGFVLESRRYSAGWTPQSHGIERLCHVQGGAWIARRILFNESGFFDHEKYPHGGMDVEFSYRLLSQNKQLGQCPSVLCPPGPAKPKRCQGVTVYHPAPREVREDVRRACGLSPLREDRTIELADLERFLVPRGRVSLWKNIGVHVRGSESPSGLRSRDAFQDLSISGRVAFNGRARLEIRAGTVASEQPGYALILGAGRGHVARGEREM
jgi:hypothetical protein